MEKKKIIGGGIYLVIDPSLDETVLTGKLKSVLKEKISVVQIWDNFSSQQDNSELINTVTRLCHEKKVPVLINNRWEWINKAGLDGVHFDQLPEDLEEIKSKIEREFIAGLTCSNDLSLVHWADENNMDYISFCSVFPSATANSCDLITFETIREAKKITTLPIFLAGGIKPENMHKLSGLSFDGIAVISGVMNSGSPGESIKKYLKHLEAKEI